MRLCCVRECARLQGETRTRCPTVPVRVETKSKEEPQHTKVRPDEQNDSDGKTIAPKYSTVSGAVEIPKGRVKIVSFLLDPKDDRTEEPEFTENKGAHEGECAKDNGPK